MKLMWGWDGNVGFEMMVYLNQNNMLGKKKGWQLQGKKMRPLSRLIKCYVCQQNFQSQGQFDIHLKQHQSKLSRTNIQEIQRKTQESFNRHKEPNPLHRTHARLNPPNTNTYTHRHKEQQPVKRQHSPEDKQDHYIEEALRESQVLLQKIQFLTQVPPSEPYKQPPQPTEDAPQLFERTIEGQKRLHQLIREAAGSTNVQKLILSTQFETRYFQNYQDQLAHLRVLASAAAKSETIAKIMKIRKNICRDICEQLNEQFDVSQRKERPRVQMMVEAKMINNTGEVKFCAECYSEVGGMDELYELECGHCYHPECWNGTCCG